MKHFDGQFVHRAIRPSTDDNRAIFPPRVNGQRLYAMHDKVSSCRDLLDWVKIFSGYALV